MSAAKVGSAGSNAVRAGRAIQPVLAPQTPNVQASLIAGLLAGDQREPALRAANDARRMTIGRMLATR